MIGVFGGSFNPLHIGHLIIAEHIRDEFHLEKVLFIPAKKPPHKVDKDMADARHRYNMVKIAIDDNPFFELSDLEINRDGFSYTADTLLAVRNQYPGKKIFFLCGADSVVNLPTWYHIDDIFKNAEMIVAGRKNTSNDEWMNMVKDFTGRYHAKFHISNVPFIEFSSTQIRERIQNGLSIRYMVPEGVGRYITLHKLY